MNSVVAPSADIRRRARSRLKRQTFDDKHERNLWLKRENISLGESSLGFFCVDVSICADCPFTFKALLNVFAKNMVTGK